MVWSLYLLPNGDHAVVTEPESFGAWMLQMMGEEYTPSDPGKFRQATQFVGEDFESFLYRFWFENRLWYNLNDDLPLSGDEHAYLDSYSLSS